MRYPLAQVCGNFSCLLLSACQPLAEKRKNCNPPRGPNYHMQNRSSSQTLAHSIPTHHAVTAGPAPPALRLTQCSWLSFSSFVLSLMKAGQGGRAFLLGTWTASGSSGRWPYFSWPCFCLGARTREGLWSPIHRLLAESWRGVPTRM